MRAKFAILMDGGFVKKKLQEQNQHFPTVQEIEAEVARIKAHSSLADRELLRVYFYDAPPASGMLKNPISGVRVDLSASAHHSHNIGLQQSLEMRPDFAVRKGEISIRGWNLGQRAMRSIVQAGLRPLTAADFVPAVEQKGVDLRIGLDIARLSLLRLVDVIVAVTGDSDMVPAFKFARREGVRVYLDHLGHGVKRELKAHTDLVL
jgi:uncharacterized LabA/DUF88 family protein